MGDFRMLSLNVRGLSNFRKRRAISAWCRKQNAHIIFLQETHSTVNSEKQWKVEWGAPLELHMGVVIRELSQYSLGEDLIAR